MFDTDFLCFLCLILKPGKNIPLEKRFDGTIFFLPEKKVTCDDSILKFPTGLEVVLRAFFRNIFTGSVFVSTKFSKIKSGNCHG